LPVAVVVLVRREVKELFPVELGVGGIATLVTTLYVSIPPKNKLHVKIKFRFLV
jgi:hypothetical protein